MLKDVLILSPSDHHWPTFHAQASKKTLLFSQHVLRAHLLSNQIILLWVARSSFPNPANEGRSCEPFPMGRNVHLQVSSLPRCFHLLQATVRPKVASCLQSLTLPPQ